MFGYRPLSQIAKHAHTHIDFALDTISAQTQARPTKYLLVMPSQSQRNSKFFQNTSNAEWPLTKPKFWHNQEENFSYLRRAVSKTPATCNTPLEWGMEQGGRGASARDFHPGCWCAASLHSSPNRCSEDAVVRTPSQGERCELEKRVHAVLCLCPKPCLPIREHPAFTCVAACERRTVLGAAKISSSTSDRRPLLALVVAVQT